MTQNKQRLILFDLDGTLIPWDTQLLFFNFVAHKSPWRRLLLIPFLLGIPLLLLHIWDEGKMKRLFLAYLAGMSEEESTALVDEFVEKIVVPGLYPDVLARLRDHQTAGDLCLLVSASPTLYAAAIGKHLGFHETLGSDTLERHPHPLFPVMPYGNNKGETKVVRLRALGYLPQAGSPHLPESLAYTDSKADIPMLLACENAVLINPSSSMQKMGIEKSWTILHPATPWSGRFDKMKKILLQFCGLYPLGDK